jgi:hypothetical protein
MSARGEGETSYFIIPGFVGGAVWFTTIFCFTDNAEKEEPTSEYSISHRRWIDLYHFYHSIYQVAVKKIRRKAKDLYLEETSELYRDTVLRVYKEVVFSDEPSALNFFEQVIPQLNEGFEWLTRIYPFSKTVLSVCSNNGGNRKLKENEFLFFGQWKVRIEQEMNQFFECFTTENSPDHQIYGDFMKLENLVKVIKRADTWVILEAQNIANDARREGNK